MLCDKLVQTVIDLLLSEDVLEHVRKTSTANEMFKCICIKFQRLTLLNRLLARRKFYSVQIIVNE